jgi:hypothetical protein
LKEPPKQQAKIPISFEELDNKTDELRLKALDPQTDIHDIANLRKALHSMDESFKEKMMRLKKNQNGVTEEFLND